MTFRACGDGCLMLDFGNVISEELFGVIRDFDTALSGAQLPILETVPGYTTLAVYYDPLVISRAQLQSALAQIQPQKNTDTAERIVEIPVCYGGGFGPDLDFVCRHCGLTAEEVIRRHSAPIYRVHMLGFTPGFPYLGGMDKSLATPRLSSPRRVIPAGSVGIAGEQTGIYPMASPGGWQLIGRTPEKLFDPGREQPILLDAGMRLRFRPVSPEVFHGL